MGSTAIGREARRRETWGDGRAGPNREHARREPPSDRYSWKRHSPSASARDYSLFLFTTNRKFLNSV